jgi:hypothetical protein
MFITLLLAVPTASSNLSFCAKFYLKDGVRSAQKACSVER